MRRSDIIVDMPSPPLEERRIGGLAGLPTLVVGVAAFVAGIGLLGLLSSQVIQHRRSAAVVPFYLAALLLIALWIAAIRGLIAVAPGEARVLQLFGSYTGTVRRSGLRWGNPLSRRITVSTRIRNNETALAKVNDAEGNPIEIAAVVVWQVEDTARALYDVDNFVQFVAFQAETAVRLVATSYPYDTHGDGPPSLLDNAEEITAKC